MNPIRYWSILSIAAIAVAFIATGTGYAVPLSPHTFYDFEDAPNDDVSTYQPTNNPATALPFTLTPSTTGVSSGSKSLEVNRTITDPNGDPGTPSFYGMLMELSDLNKFRLGQAADNGANLEFELTTTTASWGAQTFMQIFVALNIDAGFNATGAVFKPHLEGHQDPNTGAGVDLTSTVSFPISAFGGVPGALIQSSSFAQLFLAINANNNSDHTIFIDNVRITPEPTTACLALLGCLGIVVQRRRLTDVRQYRRLIE